MQAMGLGLKRTGRAWQATDESGAVPKPRSTANWRQAAKHSSTVL